jgi:hypothetical protein
MFIIKYVKYDYSIQLSYLYTMTFGHSVTDQVKDNLIGKMYINSSNSKDMTN